MSEADNQRRERNQRPMYQSQSQSKAGEGGDAQKAAPATLLSGYKPGKSAFDELLTAKGEISAPFAKLIPELESFGVTELQSRYDACRRFVQEHGITYNVYGDPLGMERPWQLDPIPFVIDPDEWHTIEAGLIQRAILL